MGRRERNATPRPGSNRAEKIAAQRARAAAGAPSAARPFAGLAAECDLIALRHFVASATAPLQLRSGDRQVRLATVLPGASQALARIEGDDVVGYAALQTRGRPEDPAAALAGAVEFAAAAEAGDSLSDEVVGSLGDVVQDAPLDITVHPDFSWWLAEGVAPEPEVAQLVEQADSLVRPAARLQLDDPALGAPWWADHGDKAFVRWVHPADEDELFKALARIHAAGGLTLGEDSRFAGSFRADGLLVPVFDVDPESHPDEWVPAARALAARITEALADTSELTGEQRRSRDGLRGRQVSI
ncbi:DUF5926 family protein [Tsukamurella sp. 8F]|uniref:DUF5926 family protein n=1 Tax=unclassified Tsukamurella TaxID=2633480 RepID=UPI0023B8A885|nr:MULTISPECIES: DUF5926 family protein [unclassified Tsukamurella]MDF0530821.1 DUF5926 family protein [Tsukamurella sp. 8J]MDF0589525.1 DUF5926 family protein [Tsukamurella sp. 8F]